MDSNENKIPRGKVLVTGGSGHVGANVVHALLEALPEERIVYLGDTARVPYGTRSAETVKAGTRPGLAGLKSSRTNSPE